MTKGFGIGLLSGLILLGVSAYAWVWHGVRDCGFQPVNEQAYRQAIASHQDGPSMNNRGSKLGE
jgi:hypothetical protein